MFDSVLYGGDTIAVIPISNDLNESAYCVGRLQSANDSVLMCVNGLVPLGLSYRVKTYSSVTGTLQRTYSTCVGSNDASVIGTGLGGILDTSSHLTIEFYSATAIAVDFEFTLYFVPDGVSTSPVAYVNSCLLNSLDASFLADFKVKTCTATAKSLRLTSTSPQLYENGMVIAGVLGMGTTLGGLSGATMFEKVSSCVKTSSQAHAEGGYVFMRPLTLPYALDSKYAYRATRVPMFMVAQCINSAGVLPSHELTVCAHYMGTTNQRQYHQQLAPIGYDWYEVMCREVDKAPGGTGNPTHSEIAAGILNAVSKAAKSNVTKYLSKTLGAVVPYGQHIETVRKVASHADKLTPVATAIGDRTQKRADEIKKKRRRRKNTKYDFVNTFPPIPKLPA
jgi:hypothetical protein